jgi:hypothetical protein
MASLGKRGCSSASTANNTLMTNIWSFRQLPALPRTSDEPMKRRTPPKAAHGALTSNMAYLSNLVRKTALSKDCFPHNLSQYLTISHNHDNHHNPGSGKKGQIQFQLGRVALLIGLESRVVEKPLD